MRIQVCLARSFLRTPIRVLLQIETCLSLTLLLLSFTGMVSLSSPSPTHRSEGVQSNSLLAGLLSDRPVEAWRNVLNRVSHFRVLDFLDRVWRCNGAVARVSGRRGALASISDCRSGGHPALMLGRLQGVEKVYTQRLRFMLHVANATHRRHAMGARSTVAMARRASAMKRSSTTAAQIVEHDHRGPTLGARPPTRLHVCQSSAGRMPVICRVLARRHRPAKARPASK